MLRARNVLAGPGSPSTGATLFRGAVDGGGRALGVPAGLVEGASADIVTLATGDLALAGRSGDRLLDAMIFGARSSVVDTVWRHGAKVVEAGRHRDRPRVAERYTRVLARLLAD
jgi:cytosine/adenosine deaminase-related metal-dependent hydrolase